MREFKKNINGLTLKEVEEQRKNGNTNVVTIKAGISVKEIILKNCMTLFNFINVVLASLLIIIGSYKNMLFIFSIIINTGSGIYQEIKAKKILEKLSILNSDKSVVIREGKKLRVIKEEIVLNDILYLTKGEQIPVDSTCIEGKLEVDESMLTGESDLVVKGAGDYLYSGSIVMQGQAKVKVCAVGNNTFVSKLTSEAKVIKRSKSQIQQQIDKILKIISFGIIPIILIVIFCQFFFSSLDFSTIEHRKQAVVGIATIITSLIPEGLVLLTSVALAVGVIKLSKKSVLTQEFSAIETLARIDVLCLDKTGTITEGDMRVKDILYYSEDKEEIDGVLSYLVYLDTEQNFSIQALKNYFKEYKGNYKLQEYIPFCSETKKQSVKIEQMGTYTLGAFDLVAEQISEQQEKDLKNALSKGFRVLALTHHDNNSTLKSKLMCFILLKDTPKKEAKQIIDYFKKQGTEVKIISGDYPKTVALIANEVGMKGEHISLGEFPTDKQKFQQMVENYTFFGRVTPEAKRDIVESLQSNGHTVGMIGDGINDVLALKKSDCPIALGNGNEATKSVSQFVLLKNNFSVLPDILLEGRKVINNITRLASMNLLRVIYILILTMLIVVTKQVFPLESINLMLMGIFTIGIPSAVLILEKDVERNKTDIFQNILKLALPVGVVLGVTIFGMFMLAYKFPMYTNLIDGEMVPNYKLFLSEVTLVIGTVQLFSLYLLSKPFTKFRTGVLIAVILLFYGTYFIPEVTMFLGIAPIQNFRFLIPTVFCILIISIIRMVLCKEIKYKKLKIISLISCLVIIITFSANIILQKTSNLEKEYPNGFRKELMEKWKEAQLNRNRS